MSLSGTLSDGNTASVDLTGGGTSTDGVDYTAALLAAAATAATGTTGVSLSGSTLTFDDTWDGSDFTFDVTAVDDSDVEGTETITLNLSGAVIDNGSVSITTADTSTDITETDQSLIFSVDSTESISEDQIGRASCRERV